MQATLEQLKIFLGEAKGMEMHLDGDRKTEKYKSEVAAITHHRLDVLYEETQAAILALIEQMLKGEIISPFTVSADKDTQNRIRETIIRGWKDDRDNTQRFGLLLADIIFAHYLAVYLGKIDVIAQSKKEEDKDAAMEAKKFIEALTPVGEDILHCVKLRIDEACDTAKGLGEIETDVLKTIKVSGGYIFNMFGNEVVKVTVEGKKQTEKTDQSSFNNWNTIPPIFFL